MPTKLGQNFLKDKKIAEKIAEAAYLKPDDLVLEIGPGKGMLTEELVKRAGKVVAVEIDKKLVLFLKNKFKDQKNVEIVEGDVLKIKMQKSKCKMTDQNAKTENIHDTLNIIPDTDYKVVANLPYYITSPIIRKFLESENPPSEMILMVQKEVAERICASPSEIPSKSRGAKRISRGKLGKMSVLAVSVRYYADAEILFNVPRENFDPIPEVDSAIIKIVPYPSSPFGRGAGGEGADFTKHFFRVVRAGFCAKRKTLINNLSNSFHLPKKEVEEKLGRIGISSRARAQELSIADWKKLAELF